MNSRDIQIEDHIHDCYSRSMYLKVYNNFVAPVCGEEEWDQTEYTPPLPPTKKIAPGRPSRKRSTRSDVVTIQTHPQDPTKLKRQRGSLKCSYCKEWKHNARSCPAKKNDELRRREEAERRDDEVQRTADASQPPSTITPGPSQPTPQSTPAETQGGVFTQSTAPQPTDPTIPRAWNRGGKSVTNRAELEKAKTARKNLLRRSR